MVWIFIAAVIIILIMVIIISYICCRIAYYVPPRKPEDVYRLSDNPQYNNYRVIMRQMTDYVLTLEYEDVYVRSHDGLMLHAKFYKTADNAPVQILFHGYKSVSEKDYCGGLRLAVDSGFNALLVDQRAHGKSRGKYLSFGINERYDCLDWVNYISNRFGKDTKIILSGISMGAATVLMAASLELPENVAGIIADCGYSSPSAIIRKVLADRKYPVWLFYPFVRLGGILFGRFDIESASAVDAMKNSRVPVLLIHGEDDRFVPCDMSRENFAACVSEKRLVTFPGAGHALSYLVDTEAYKNAVSEFLASVLPDYPVQSREEKS